MVGPYQVPVIRSALARLQQLGDPEFVALAERNERFIQVYRTQHWAHLRDTFHLHEWMPLLEALGCDQGNVQSLALLAQQGLAGRVETNRLLSTWANPVPGDYRNYVNAPQVYQASIRRARQFIDRPCENHQDYAAWVPGVSLGPYWVPKDEFFPAVRRLDRGYVEPVTLESRPYEVLSAQHRNGTWSTGWWYDDNADTWKWHWQRDQ